MRSICAILLLILVSCGNHAKETPKAYLAPDTLFSREKMADILVDVHLIESRINLQRNKGGNVPQLTAGYYEWLYKKYHISEKSFRSNLNYYKRDPEDFSKLYEDVVKMLTDRVAMEKQKQGKPGPS